MKNIEIMEIISPANLFYILLKILANSARVGANGLDIPGHSLENHDNY